MRPLRAAAFAIVIVLVIVATAASMPAALAQTACPKSAEPGKGIALGSAGGRTSVVSWLADGRVKIAEQNPKAPRSFPRETIAVKGLIGTELVWPGNKAQLEFQTPVDSVFPLTIGKQHELAYVARRAGQAPLKGQMTVAVLEALQHAIGACTYDALLVGSVSAFEDGTQTPMRYDVYIPALQAVVKSTVFDGPGQNLLVQETFEFEEIKAR